MKSLWIVLLFGLAVATAAGFYGWRSSRLQFEVALAEQTNLSNKLFRATTELAEKDAAIQTLTIKQKLQGEDAATQSNRLREAQDALAKALERSRSQTAAAQAREAEIVGLNERSDQLRQASAHLQAELESARRDLLETRSALAQTQQQLDELSAQRNASEMALTQLLGKWEDPSSVRSQLETLRKSPGSSRRSAKGQGPVAIQPDGRVVLVPDRESR